MSEPTSPVILDLRDKNVRSLGELVSWCAELELPRVLLTEQQKGKLGIIDARAVDIVGECSLTPRELQVVSLVEVP